MGKSTMAFSIAMLVYQRVICSSFFEKDRFSPLKRATCEDGFLLFIHATEGHQAPQGAVLPTVHPHLDARKAGKQQEWKHRDIHWINMYKYTRWWFEPL